MSTLFIVIAVIFVASFVPATFLLVRNYLRFRKTRTVICPECEKPAQVKLGAFHAAWTSVVDEPDVRLASCSHAPEAAQCSQGCLPQAESTSADPVPLRV